MLLHTNLQVTAGMMQTLFNRSVQSIRAGCQPNAEGLSFDCRASGAKYVDLIYFSLVLILPQHHALELCNECALPGTIICANFFICVCFAYSTRANPYQYTQKREHYPSA